MNNDLISIAKILNFHGIKGEAKVGFTKGRESQIEKLERVFVRKDDDYLTLHIISQRFHKHYVIMKFKEFSTVNDVELYKGCELFLPKSEVEKNLDDDEYLISDLVGMEVFDEDDALIGTICAVGENLANDIIEIIDNNHKKHLVPFVKALVPVVDLKKRRIVINNIEGLIN